MPTYPYQFRRDTLANWKSANPVLREGEMGLELPGVVGDDGVKMFKFKIGDGATAWNALPYASGPAGPSPEYQWSGTSLRFMNPDGTWGSYVNLRGPQGTKGEQGDPGPAGTATPATKTTIGGVIIGDNINVTANGCISVIGLVPVGGIVAFSGTFSRRNPIDMKTKKVMTGWCLCDGTATNGLAVPDLRDRMIMGAGTTYQTGSKGGAATHTHSVSATVGGTTTTVAQTAKHYHEQGTQVVDDARVPSWGRRGSKDTCRSGWQTSIGAAVGWSGSVSDAGASASHTHSLTGVKSGSASSLPPYYALAYIMRIA